LTLTPTSDLVAKGKGVGPMAEIQITRKNGWVDRFRAYTVWIDGANVGKIRAGQNSAFEVEPGEHKIQLRIDWCGSRIVELTAGKKPAILECRHGIFPGLQLLALVFAPRRWIDLNIAS
jgi:hypothetical protein